MTRVECIQKIRHIQASMYTFEFEDGKSHKFKADDADKFYYYLDMIAKYLDEELPKEKEPKTDTWSIKDVADTLAKHGLIAKQEPCEDAISREHLLGEIASLKESPWFKENTNGAMAIRKEAIEIVEDLCIRKEPSVNPQRIGHWIYDRTRDLDGECKYECSECGMGSDVDYSYCMRCGAKMIEPQESEDKE